MDEQEAHKLERIIYETNFDSEVLAYQYQSRISGFIEKDLAEVIDEVCTQLDDKNKVISIDRLEFDLGHFKYDTSDHEIKERFREELYKALSQKIADIALQPTHNEQIIEKELSEYLHLLHYLRKGTLSWNVKYANPKPLETALDNAIQHKSTDFVKWLKLYGRHRYVQKRIVYQFADPQIIAIIEKLDQANAPFIKRYSGDLRQSHKKERLIEASESEFRDITWEVILSYMLSDRGSRFNRKSFVKYTLAQIAMRKKIEYSVLLDAFFKAIPKLLKNEVFRSEFPEIIVELNEEHQQEAKNRKSPVDMAEDKKAQSLQELTSFLQGKLKGISSEILEYLATHHLVDFIKLLRHFTIETTSGENHLELFTDAQLKFIAQILEPSQREFVWQFTEYLETSIDRQDIKSSDTDFRKSKWEVILVYLLENQEGVFNRKAFIKSTILEISERIGLSYKEVLMLLYYNISKISEVNEGSNHIKDILTELQNEAITEYQKRILPDDEILQILYTHELYDGIIFYVENGYTSRKFASSLKSGSVHSLLYELRMASSEMILRYLAYLQNEDHLQLLLRNTDKEFVETTAVLYMKMYYSPSDDEMKQFQTIIEQVSGGITDNTYYTRLISKLVQQSERSSATIINEIENYTFEKTIPELTYPISLPTLHHFITSFLKEEKKDLGFGIRYTATWKYFIETYPDNLSWEVKYVLRRPKLFQSFLKLSDYKLLHTILEELSPSAYTIKFVDYFSQSLGINTQSIPNKLKTELWEIVFDSVLESKNQNESDITDYLLTKALLSITDANYRKRYLRTLKKNVKSFNTMDRYKTLAIIEQVESQLFDEASKHELFELKKQVILQDPELFKSFLKLSDNRLMQKLL
ncbi:MAG: hypothetical protein MI922_25885, partial [Bacteroidales bacterium]|nr:hypothetical protein [Bacteroidales bacterium]